MTSRQPPFTADGTTQPNILFFGMLGQLSLRPLQALLNRGQVTAVFIPATAIEQAVPQPIIQLAPPPPVSELPMLTPFAAANILHLAWQQQIPVYAVRQLAAAETLATLAALQPDIICVSCFLQKLPPSILQLPPLGCFNLHPSALPKFRGPAPLFWQLRAGLSEIGITIHQMDSGLDSGPIAAQTAVSLQPGWSDTQIETAVATAGGKLFAQTVTALVRGRCALQPQDASAATVQPWPAAADFSLDLRWTAQQAFNFMRGTSEWGVPYRVTAPAGTLTLHEAIAVAPEAHQVPVWKRRENSWSIQFAAGILIAR